MGSKMIYRIRLRKIKKIIIINYTINEFIFFYNYYKILIIEIIDPKKLYYNL